MMRDLVSLVADNDMEQALEGVLARSHSLKIRPVSHKVYRHAQRDSGCRTQSLKILRPLAKDFRYGLVLFDHEGSGGEKESAEHVEFTLQAELESNGWKGRACAIAIEPELEAWMWSDSPEVDRILGWQAREPALRPWLALEGFAFQNNGKPVRPKEAIEQALYFVKKRPSAALFGEMASKVSLSRCTERSFVKLRDTLRTWFPAAS